MFISLLHTFVHVITEKHEACLKFEIKLCFLTCLYVSCTRRAAQHIYANHEMQ